MPKFEKDINTINYAPLIKSVEARGKDPSLIFERSGLTREYLFSRRNYVDIPTGIVIWTAVKDILNEQDPMLFYDLGLEVVKNQELGGLLTIGRALGGIEDALRFIPRFNKKFNDLFDMTVLDIHDNTGVIVIDYKKRQYDGTWIFDQCLWNRGNIAGIPYEWGLPFIDIEEVVNRFSLQEIFRDYAFMGHQFTVDEKSGAAFVNRKEIAVPVRIKSQTLKKALDKIDSLNPLEHKEQTLEVLTNQGCEIIDRFNPQELQNAVYGMAIVKDTKVSDRFTLKEGHIYAHPACRIASRLNLSWTGRKNISRTIRDSIIGQRIYAKEIIAGYEKEMQLNLEQRRKIQEYADHLEEMVEERTAELNTAYQTLKDTQEELVREEVAKAEREKELHMEKAMSGGLAHEGRNALMPAAIQLRRLMEYQEQQSAFDLLSNKSGSLLQQIIKLENEYNLPQEKINQEIIPIFREINDVIKDINNTTQEISMGVGKGLGLIDLFRTYSKTQEMTRGIDQVDVEKIARDLGETYKKRLTESGITYTVNVIDKDPIITGDYLHIESIIKNLVLNAMDALEKAERKEIIVSIAEVFKDGGNEKSRHTGPACAGFYSGPKPGARWYPEQDEVTGFRIESGMTNEGNPPSGEASKDKVPYLHIEVSDAGEGIPEDQQSKIFQAFYTTKSAKGTGLGLSIVKRMVEIYEGRIDVQSDAGKGTKFVVELKM